MSPIPVPKNFRVGAWIKRLETRGKCKEGKWYQVVSTTIPEGVPKATAPYISFKINLITDARDYFNTGLDNASKWDFDNILPFNPTKSYNLIY